MAERTVEAVAFDAENCSAVQRLDDHEREEACHCGDGDCETCKGAGHYVKKVLGWKRSRVLAPNVQAYIEQALRRQFRLAR